MAGIVQKPTRGQNSSHQPQGLQAPGQDSELKENCCRLMHKHSTEPVEQHRAAGTSSWSCNHSRLELTDGSCVYL